jgi:catechol 2,3-dioxygenase-like lactoylglutathione lyase family enzyme
MITGVQDIYYNITDRERSVRFYTEALGMKCISNEPYRVALDCHGVKLGLHPEDKVHQVPRDSHGAHGQATLTLRSNDVKADRAKIEQAEGKILAENEQAWGHMLVFEDPDGNVLKLMNPKQERP